jgi:hypothetical protein
MSQPDNGPDNAPDNTAPLSAPEANADAPLTPNAGTGEEPGAPGTADPLLHAGPLAVFRIGLSVYWSELRWLGVSLLRRYEISRLAKRLREEYTRLGRVAEAPRGKMPEKELCLKQIAFLKEEMATLEKELEARRMERVNLLRRRAEGNPAAGA